MAEYCSLLRAAVALPWKGVKISTTAKQEIMDFISSGEAGFKSEFSRLTLLNAAQSIFTANGLICPVQIVDVKGEAYIINREIAKAISNTNGNGKH